MENTDFYMAGFNDGQFAIFSKYMDMSEEAARIAFSTQRFFTRKLWRKVDGFRDAEESSVKSAFLWHWMEEDIKSNKDVFSSGIAEYVGANQDSRYAALFEEYREWIRRKKNRRNLFSRIFHGKSLKIKMKKFSKKHLK